MKYKSGLARLSLILVTVFVASNALATDPQTIESFRRAVQAADSNPQGTCDSIPYQSLRERCQSLGSSLQEYCKNKPRTCEGLETKPLSEKISNIEKAIESLKSSSKDDDKRKISDLQRELEFTKKSRETDMSDASIRIDNGDRCLDVRNTYSSVFKDAASKANDQRDSDIRDLRDKLINYWDARNRAHEEETKRAKAAQDYCKEVKSGNK